MTSANMLIIIGSILIPLLGFGGASFLFLLNRMDRMESGIRAVHNRAIRIEGYIAQAFGANINVQAEPTTHLTTTGKL